ncbi:transcriptional regulator [Paenibacillus odorifer]|uniref:Crp/Fnr family transcriptional regulator n=1 Tax=Paenibacillus TaxID=44249 RepID=UPI00096C50FA|nr:Crp/Fnr family transcriptional regulator [Paenibacillus odorifer]OMD84232.1 transcriptional regulator [Paenibacillus odorifer]
MKSIHDPNLISHYITQFNLDQVFTTSTHALIQLLVYEQNEIILREGDELDGIYFQVEGRTKVSSSVGTGKSLLLRFCSPLSLFGDIEYVQEVVIQSQVEAVQQTSLLFIPKQKVESDLMDNHRFKDLLLKHLSYKLLTCTSASRTNLLGSVEERFASYLLTIQLQREFGKEIQTPYIPDIASLIGTTPRHLNRVIQRLTDMGILYKVKQEIIVLDWERLDELSNGIRFE